MTGLYTAIHELPLVLFTTIAPSGAVAYAVLAALLLSGRTRPEDVRRMEKVLGVPIVIVLGGLVASASHLGTPTNALYVLTRIGKSPLSNEMAAIVVFLGFASALWLYSFAEAPNRAVKKSLLVLSLIGSLVFLVCAGYAYSPFMSAIVTWALPTVPAGLVLTAIVGGPVLALTVMRVAGIRTHGIPMTSSLVALSIVALIASTATFVAQGLAYVQISNYVVTATELVPQYWPMVVSYALLCAGGIAAVSTRTRPGSFIASTLVLGGIFVMRFAFYMSYMTEGIGF